MNPSLKQLNSASRSHDELHQNYSQIVHQQTETKLADFEQTLVEIRLADEPEELTENSQFAFHSTSDDREMLLGGNVDAPIETSISSHQASAHQLPLSRRIVQSEIAAPLHSHIAELVSSTQIAAPILAFEEFESIAALSSSPDSESMAIESVPNQAHSSSPSIDSFLDESNSHITQDAKPAPEVSTRATLPPEIRSAATQSVTEVLVSNVKLAENGSSKTLVLQLHPAELGQVTLQLDWDNDVLKAKITTNEVAASEVLNQSKPHLIAALAENGFTFDSLDVSYQDAPSDQQRDQPFHLSTSESTNNSETSQPDHSATIEITSTVVNIVV